MPRHKIITEKSNAASLYKTMKPQNSSKNNKVKDQPEVKKSSSASFANNFESIDGFLVSSEDMILNHPEEQNYYDDIKLERFYKTQLTKSILSLFDREGTFRIESSSDVNIFRKISDLILNMHKTYYSKHASFSFEYYLINVIFQGKETNVKNKIEFVEQKRGYITKAHIDNIICSILFEDIAECIASAKKIFESSIRLKNNVSQDEENKLRSLQQINWEPKYHRDRQLKNESDKVRAEASQARVASRKYDEFFT